MKTVIVVAYNNKVDMTKEFLDNMQKYCQFQDVELILVNGGSSTKIEHSFITKRIDLEKNEGFCNTLNHGLQYAINHSTADYLFFVGNDSFPTNSNWLSDLIDLHNETGSMMTCPANDNPGMEAYRHCYTKEAPGYWEASMFPSIAWLAKMDDVKKIGLLDENYLRTGMYADNDYCDRILHAGGKIVVSKNILLKHLLSAEGRELGTQQEDMAINRAYYYHKWHSKQ